VAVQGQPSTLDGRRYQSHPIALIIVVARRPHHPQEAMDQAQGRRCITVGRFQGVEGVHRIAGTDHQQAVEQCVHQQHFDLFNFH